MKHNLSRKQLVAARKQAREARQKEVDSLREENEEAYEEKQKKLKDKKDKMGFTQEERKEIALKKTEINKPKATVTWNYKEGELVYLPNGEIGIIVKNNAKNLEIDYSYVNPNASLSRYDGKIFVVTSSGNNWYYPKTLKPVYD